MDMFLGMGAMMLLIPFNFIILKLTDSNFYQSFGGIILMMVGSITLLTLYVVGVINSVNHMIPFVIGLFISVIFNLITKVYIVQKS